MAKHLSRLSACCSPRRMQACVYHLMKAVFKSVLHFVGNFEASLDGGAERLEFDSDTSIPLVVLLNLVGHFGSHYPRVFSCVGASSSDVEHEGCLGSEILLLLSGLHDSMVCCVVFSSFVFN